MPKRTSREHEESTSSSEDDDIESSSSSLSSLNDEQESLSSEEERARNVFSADQKRSAPTKPIIDLSSIKLLSYDDMMTSGKVNKIKNPIKSNDKEEKTIADAGDTTTTTQNQQSASLASAEENNSVFRYASENKAEPSKTPNVMENSDVESQKDDLASAASDDGNVETSQHEGEKASLATSKTSKSQSKTNVLEKREAQLKKQLRNQVHRQAKLAKKFELRHIIRMLQKAKSKANGDKRVANLEERLEKAKKVDIEDLVSASLSAAEKDFFDAHPQDKLDESEDENQKDKEDKDSVASMRLNDPVLIIMCGFEPLKAAAKEYFERPFREQKRREKERLQKAAEAEREAKQLERQKNPLLCGIHMCMARFATEEARTTHRIKRHKTTGDWKKDMEMGLRTKKPNQRERKAFELLKKGGSLEEIDELLRPPKHLRKTPSAKEKLEKQKSTAEENGEDSNNAPIDRPLRGQHGPQRDKPNDRQPSKLDRMPAERPQRSFPANDDSAPAQKFKQESSMSAEKPVLKSAGFDDRKQDEVKRSRVALRDAVNKAQAKPHEPSLHPSWEAKKKQALVAEFQGSKVEFDDDED